MCSNAPLPFGSALPHFGGIEAPSAELHCLHTALSFHCCAMIRHIGLLLALLALAIPGCQSSSAPNAPQRSEQPVRLLPLKGPLADADAEISGRTW